MSLHSFCPEIAERVGVNAAVVYQNFLFWCEKNKANRRHIRDGYVWTYNSRRAVAELFPYLTEKQARTAIAKLVDSGLLVKGEYNIANYDKTNWYAPTVSADWVSDTIGPKGPMDRPSGANGSAQKGQPIPYDKPVGKPDGKLSVSKDNIDDCFSEFWERYPRKLNKAKAKAVYARLLKKDRHDDIMFGLSQHLPSLIAREQRYIPHATTWLNGRCWEDQPEIGDRNDPSNPIGGPTGNSGARRGAHHSLMAGFADAANS